MEVGDGVTGSFGQNLLSLEDQAWADSCLSKEPEALCGSWGSLKEALIETEGAQYVSSSHEVDAYSEYPRLVNLPSGEETGSTNHLVTTDEAGTSSDVQLVPENADDFWSKHKVADVFLPTYKGESVDLGTSDPEMDLANQPFQWDLLLDDIFKVWDLEVLPEEDGLIKQLKKVLEESYSDPTTPTLDDDSQELNVSVDELLDELVYGMADLTLSQDPAELF